MRKALLLIFGLIAFSVPAFAQSCQDANAQCVTSCCSKCGGTTWTDNSSGEMFCQGPGEHQTQQCIDACLQCAHDYQQCTSGSPTPASQGAHSSGMPNYAPKSGCCGSAALLGAVLGLAMMRSG